MSAGERKDQIRDKQAFIFEDQITSGSLGVNARRGTEVGFQRLSTPVPRADQDEAPPVVVQEPGAKLAAALRQAGDPCSAAPVLNVSAVPGRGGRQ